MSLTTAASSSLLAQAARVRSSLTGPGWHQSISRPAPLPSWLVDVVDGHIEPYVGPDPVLFRTAGLGVEWFFAADDHPDQLTVTDAYQRVPVDELRAATELLTLAGGVVDADAYLWGDGNQNGHYSARIHCLFGVFTDTTSIPELVGRLDDLSAAFTLSIVPGPVALTAQVMPQLQVAWA